MTPDGPPTTIQRALQPTPWDYSEPEQTDQLVDALQDYVRDLQVENATLRRALAEKTGDVEVTEPEAEPDESQFERGYFHYGVYVDEDERTCIGVTTRDEWNLHGACKDGYTEDEAERIYAVMEKVFATESMESIFEVPGHRPEEVHVAMLPFVDFARNDEFSEFLASVNA